MIISSHVREIEFLTSKKCRKSIYDPFYHHSSSHRVTVFSALTLNVSTILKQSYRIIHLWQQANVTRVLDQTNKINEAQIVREKYLRNLKKFFIVREICFLKIISSILIYALSV